MRFRDQRQNNGQHLPAGPVPEWDFRAERAVALAPCKEVEAFIAELRAAGDKRTVHVDPDRLDIVVKDILFILKPSQLTNTAEACVVHEIEVMRFPFKDAKVKFFEGRKKENGAPTD